MLDIDRIERSVKDFVWKLYPCFPYFFTYRLRIETTLSIEECAARLQAACSPFEDMGKTWGLKPVFCDIKDNKIRLMTYIPIGGPMYIAKGDISEGCKKSAVRVDISMKDIRSKARAVGALAIGAFFPILTSIVIVGEDFQSNFMKSIIIIAIVGFVSSILVYVLDRSMMGAFQKEKETIIKWLYDSIGSQNIA